MQAAMRQLEKWQTVLIHLRVLICDQNELKGVYDFGPGCVEMLPIPQPGDEDLPAVLKVTEQPEPEA